jgi:hypothetical protein
MDAPTAEQAECRRSHREQIGAGVDLIAPPKGLLRSHIRQCAEGSSCPRSEAAGAPLEQTRQTKVENLHATIGGQKEILRF